jgi:double-stranded uracil-DNA glycosylase
MPTEVITVRGTRIRTLPEMLRPSLRAIIVGINPSPVSVLAGHYYQGQLGQRLWQRLTQSGILTGLSEGNEDVIAFRQGFGFTDLIRKPTARAAELTAREIADAVPDLIQRLKPYAKDDPLILFVFKQAADAVGPSLKAEGFRIQKLPAPFLKSEKVETVMNAIKRELDK